MAAGYNETKTFFMGDSTKIDYGKRPDGMSRREYSAKMLGGNKEDYNNDGSLKTASSSSKTPTAKEQLQPYLDNYQKAIVNEQTAKNSPFKSDQEIFQGVQQAVLPATPAPVAPKLTDLYQQLRSDNDVQTLETTLTDLKAQEEELHASLRQTKTGERNKMVATSVIAGRIGKAEQQAMEEIDFIGRQKTRINDELQMRYGVINTMMDLTQKDYENASREYNDQFNRNIQVYNVFRAEKQSMVDQRNKEIDRATNERQRAEDKAFEVSNKIIQFEREDAVRREDAARSNLQIYANMIKSGNMDMGSLNAQTKAAIAKMEVSSGLGLGFISKLRSDNPNGEVKSMTTREGADGIKYADVIVQNPDGSLKVSTMSLGSYRVATSSSEEKSTDKERESFQKDAKDYADKVNSGELTKDQAKRALGGLHPDYNADFLDTLIAE
jgi:hypothetical protein